MACLSWCHSHKNKPEAKTHNNHSLCERCWNDEETPLHALWSCKELSSIWSPSEWSSWQNSGVTNFKELLSWILNNQGNSELFEMITWGIWHQWNQVHNHKPCYTSDQITSQAKEKLAELFAVLPPTPLAIPKPKARWKPLDARFVKINFNGATFRTETKVVLVLLSTTTHMPF